MGIVKRLTCNNRKFSKRQRHTPQSELWIPWTCPTALADIMENRQTVVNVVKPNKTTRYIVPWMATKNNKISDLRQRFKKAGIIQKWQRINIKIHRNDGCICTNERTNTFDYDQLIEICTKHNTKLTMNKGIS